MSLQHYQYLSVALALVAAIFAVLYFTQPEPTVSDVYEDVGEYVQACQDSLNEWKEEYGDQPDSAEKQEALDAVLDECETELSREKERLN